MNADRNIANARYEQDGIVFPISVLSADEVSENRNALDSIAARCGEIV